MQKDSVFFSPVISKEDREIIFFKKIEFMFIELTTTGKSKVQPKSGQSFVAYNVIITDGILQCQFAELYDSLKKLLNSRLPELPPNQMLGRFKSDFILARKNKLQQYINAIICLPVALQKRFVFFFCILVQTQIVCRWIIKKKMKVGLLEVRDRLKMMIESIDHKSFNAEQVSFGLTKIFDIVDCMCKKTSDSMTSGRRPSKRKDSTDTYGYTKTIKSSSYAHARSRTIDSAVSESALKDDVFDVEGLEMMTNINIKKSGNFEELTLLPHGDDSQECGMLLISIDDFADISN
ncbi:hypothetical protein RFI_02130 [Reticulomyxa filosa]|uniref:PX domain-containing protein n=1 Tax=Reticulomyxa filosa TaxID=46433 RepID=X6PA63_RETFI|nr:hypothetical protein RFI_02130 [Reticulomyxa filosa]|eukprot:ETO34944.1 hypothetical protein RFI_02130 [Reticulomyxa filosa]